MEATIKIPEKSNLKGEDGYKIFSVRIRNETANALEELSARSNRSRNELINMILDISETNEIDADLNGDGRVNVSDVSALINIILGIQ